MNQGDDIAGLIHAVGPNITEFHLGDRVAAFHEMCTPHGSYAEYALAWAYTTFHLPTKTSFEEAAALPLAAMTAAIGLYRSNRLALPEPWAPVSEKLPLVVYGGATAVGSYVLQFAKRSNFHPLIVVAGRGAEHVEGLIDRSKGDAIVDYRGGDEAVVSGIKDALKKAGVEKVEYVFDAVSEKGSSNNIAKVLDPHGKITCVLPVKDDDGPESIVRTMTMVGSVHSDETDERDFGSVYFRYIGRALQEGWFKAHPTEVVKGGLAGVQEALTNLKEGKASAVKYVFRVQETEGAGRDE